MRVGPKQREPRRAEAIDDAGDERPFRTDDGEVDVLALHERDQAVDVGRGDIGVADAGLARGAGVAGRDDDFVDARRIA